MYDKILPACCPEHCGIRSPRMLFKPTETAFNSLLSPHIAQLNKERLKVYDNLNLTTKMTDRSRAFSILKSNEIAWQNPFSYGTTKY